MDLGCGASGPTRLILLSDAEGNVVRGYSFNRDTSREGVHVDSNFSELRKCKFLLTVQTQTGEW